MIGASALHETQIVGVIDDPGKIGVLVIDADLHVMAAVADHAVEGGLSLTHRGRRRGGTLASGCVPPMRASRRAASGSTHAFNASLTTADSSVTPPNSFPLPNNSSSIPIVNFT